MISGFYYYVYKHKKNFNLFTITKTNSKHYWREIMEVIHCTLSLPNGQWDLFVIIIGEVRNFCLESQVAALIYLSRQSPYIYTHTCFVIIHTHTHIYIYILFDKLYIYTHTPNQKKKTLVFSIKIMFDSDLL